MCYQRHKIERSRKITQAVNLCLHFVEDVMKSQRTDAIFNYHAKYRPVIQERLKSWYNKVDC